MYNLTAVRWEIKRMAKAMRFYRGYAEFSNETSAKPLAMNL